MLIMCRHEGESILIGDDIEIVIAHIGRTRVKVGIKAPREIPVVAREIKLVGEANRAAARPPLPAAVRRLVSNLNAAKSIHASPQSSDECVGKTFRQDTGTET